MEDFASRLDHDLFDEDSSDDHHHNDTLNHINSSTNSQSPQTHSEEENLSEINDEESCQGKRIKRLKDDISPSKNKKLRPTHHDNPK